METPNFSTANADTLIDWAEYMSDDGLQGWQKDAARVGCLRAIVKALVMERDDWKRRHYHANELLRQRKEEA
jgi:hypothetical protein